MNIATLRRKRVLLPALAAVAVIGVGGTVWTASAQDEVRGTDRDRAAAAAEKAAGGGTAVEVEAGDDAGEAFEVEVRTGDGREVDVALDENLEPLGQDADDRDDDDTDGIEDADRDNDAPDGDDRAVSAEERRSAEQAALSAVGGGTVEQVEGSDDRGEAFRGRGPRR
jgi:hypothetical protein